MLTKTKQWGNSLALIIPKSKVRELHLKPGEEVEVRLEKRTNALKQLFGVLRFSKSTEQLLKEAREKTSKWE